MYNYMPIASSAEKSYSPLPQHETTDTSITASTDYESRHEEDREDDINVRPRSQTVWQTRWNIILSFTTILLLAVAIIQQTIIYQYQHPKDHYIISPYRTVLRQYGLDTPYKSMNHTEAAEAWDKISSGHGDVSIDPAWAAARGLPESMRHPYQPDKQVYQLEAYHAMHCLKSVRNHFMTMMLPNAGDVHPSFATDPSSWEVEHDMHCFDELRQHIMCNADDALMYSSGHRDIGWQQYRLCRDWDQLEAWATDNSACWKDHINPRPEGERWWHQCDGSDGLMRTGEVGL